MKTFSPKPSDVERKWYIVDAADQPVGRICTEVARVLRGKHKPTFARHIDTGDFVIVLNAEKAIFTGRKEDQKKYYRHSTYPGNLKQETAAEVRKKRPTRIIERAVRGMLPKNKLGRAQLKKLKVYAGAEHPHAAQKPEALEVGPLRAAS